MPAGLEDFGHRPLIGASESAGFSYREAAPPARRDLVSRVWTSITPGPEPYVLPVVPDGCVELAFTPGHGTVVFGPATQPQALRLEPATRHGLRLHPAVAATLLGDPAVLSGQCVAAEAVGVRDVADDAPHGVWLLTMIDAVAARSERRPPDPLAVAAAALIRRRPDLRVAGVARALGQSERQLRRRFVRAVGITPVSYRRIARVRRAARAAADHPPSSWSRFAAEHGFSDQAHLVRECRALLGVRPRGLVAG